MYYCCSHFKQRVTLLKEEPAITDVKGLFLFTGVTMRPASINSFKKRNKNIC